MTDPLHTELSLASTHLRRAIELAKERRNTTAAHWATCALHWCLPAEAAASREVEQETEEVMP